MELGNFLFGNSRGEYTISRDMMSSIVEWDFLLDKCNCDLYGCYKLKENLPNNKSEYCGFKNDTFEIFPYYWGNCTCGMEDKDKPCTSDCLLLKPNFIYFPDNTVINWYKYPFRDAYSNKEMDAEQWRKMFVSCIESIKSITQNIGKKCFKLAK